MNEDERRSELARLWLAPIGVPTESSLIEPPIRLMDGPSFAAQYEEIFVREIYAFVASSDEPVILDGGANVGAGVIWWRARWPKARVVAFEPDPAVFETLQFNTRYHPDVELRRAALSTPELGRSFISQGTDAGRLGPAAGDGQLLEVPTVRLGTVLAELGRVDLCKLDIEGAETAVLLDAADELWRVEHLFFEYHAFRDAPQRLGELLELLVAQGFRYRIDSPLRAVRPFVEVPDGPMDLQCNVFATRTSPAPSGMGVLPATRRAAGRSAP